MPKQLTSAEKRRDFLFLFDALKENYPYFGLRKRADGKDWLAEKEPYLARIEAATDDRAFVLTLQSILGELRDDHLGLAATRYGHRGYREAYEKIESENPDYETWVDVLRSSGRRIDYWAAILDDAERRTGPRNDPPPRTGEPPPDDQDAICAGGSIAVMSFRSFSVHLVERDKDRIDRFSPTIERCRTLIIDIQQNGGGSTKYWQENIVERLASDTICHDQYLISKDGSVNRRFYPRFFEEARAFEVTDTLRNAPPELGEEPFYIRRDTDSIAPRDPIRFDGKIYLLVDSKVFSSSEGFAHFCKTTGWATVAGERTGGDGVGSDPALILLPQSRIIVTCPSLVGLNHDGSLNAEERTVPDIRITGEDPRERLDNLIEHIRGNDPGS